MKSIYIKIAGVINLITALIHVVSGQLDLVNPLIDSKLGIQQKGELISVWHMVTILLFYTSYILIRIGFDKSGSEDYKQLKSVGILYLILAAPFIIISAWYSIFAPQWILLLLIGMLVLYGIKNKPINE